MAFLRSSRHKRIDRALYSVLNAIDAEHDRQMWALPDNHTWSHVNALTFQRDTLVIDAYKRANKLCAMWQARVERDEDTI